MSTVIRGQEVSVQFSVDGVPQSGSFTKLKEFRVSERGEIRELDYLGESTSDLDFQHHGYDISFTVDNEDASTIDYLLSIVAREKSGLAHPKVNMTVVTRYRNPSVASTTVVYKSVVMRAVEHGFSSRKENVTTSFEAKAKEMAAL